MGRSAPAVLEAFKMPIVLLFRFEILALFALAIAAPKLMRLRIRFFKWIHLTWAVRVHEEQRLVPEWDAGLPSEHSFLGEIGDTRRKPTTTPSSVIYPNHRDIFDKFPTSCFKSILGELPVESPAVSVEHLLSCLLHETYLHTVVGRC